MRYEDFLTGRAPQVEIECLAGEDLSTYQYYFVLVDTYRHAVIQDPASSLGAFGFLQNAPTAGEPAIVRFDGFTYAIAADAISALDPVQVATGADEGKVKKWTIGTHGHTHLEKDLAGQTDPPTGSSITYMIGWAITAGGAGDTIEVFIDRHIF